MSDPNVKKLNYKMVPADFVSFPDAAPVTHETQDFIAKLDGDSLVVEMKTHCSSAEEALAIVQPFVTGWEISSGLKRGFAELSFVFKNAEVVGHSLEGGFLSLVGCLPTLIMNATASSEVVKKSFPPPPEIFRANIDIEILWRRYTLHLEGREPLLSMAYYILTYMKHTYVNKDNAAVELLIDRKVIHEAFRLVSVCGDSDDARKVNKQESQPLTQRERSWLDAVIRLIIMRMGMIPEDITEAVTMNSTPPFV